MSAAVLAFKPRVGRWYQGGRFAGNFGGSRLLLGGLTDAPLTWAAAMAWAAGLTVGGHSWELPTMQELHALGAAFPHLFTGEVYWSCESHDILSSDAIVCHFGVATDTHWGKHFPALAAAVRLAPIH